MTERKHTGDFRMEVVNGKPRYYSDLTDDQLLLLVALARATAADKSTMHSIWECITDAKSHAKTGEGVFGTTREKAAEYLLEFVCQCRQPE